MKPPRCPDCGKVRMRRGKPIAPSEFRSYPLCRICSFKRRRSRRHLILRPIDWGKAEARCARCLRTFLVETINFCGGYRAKRWPICLGCREQGWMYQRGALIMVTRQVYMRQDGRRAWKGGDPEKEAARRRRWEYRNGNKVKEMRRTYRQSQRGRDIHVVQSRLRIGWSLHAARNTPIQRGPRKGHIPNV